jgi:hypothetical protein
MRLVRLTLALALLSLVDVASCRAAPAPLPRRDREAPRARQERLLAECRWWLDELKVKWWVEDRGGGRQLMRFNVDLPDERSSMGGGFPVSGDDLPGALRQVIEQVEYFFFKYQDRL